MKTRAISLVGILIFAVAEIIFNISATAESTNWSIIYFSSTYLAVTLVCMDLFFSNPEKAIRYTAISFASMFILLMSIELSFINSDFNIYISNVSASKVKSLIFLSVSIVLIIITLKTWARAHCKRF